MQTILGSGGTIGTALATELTRFTDKVRLVSRNPKKVNESDELIAADLTDPQMVDKAVKGSKVVYLTVGLDYNLKVWEENWPKIMKATIEACIKNFLDAINEGNITALIARCGDEFFKKYLCCTALVSKNYWYFCSNNEGDA